MYNAGSNVSVPLAVFTSRLVSDSICTCAAPSAPSPMLSVIHALRNVQRRQHMRRERCEGNLRRVRGARSVETARLPQRRGMESSRTCFDLKKVGEPASCYGKRLRAGVKECGH